MVDAAYPVRVCIGCTKRDDHPRHILIDPSGVDLPMHLDCCALARNCESCAAQLAGVGGVSKNPKGDKLREYLVKTGPSAEQPGWTPPADEEILAAHAARKEG